MSIETISDKQGISITALFIMGASLVLPTAVEAERDLWLAILLSMGMSLPFIFMYARLLSIYPGKDFFDISTMVLGKVIGKIINVLYIGFALLLSSLIVRDFGEFVATVSMPETPRMVTMTALTILCILGVKQGIELIGRWGELVLPINIFLIVLVICLLIPQMKLTNIQPVLYHGIQPVFKGAYTTFAFPFGEIVILTMAFHHFKWKQSSYKILGGGVLIGGLIVFITSFAEITLLGINLYQMNYFPGYAAVARINIGDFIQRLEIVVTFAFLSGLFIKNCICILAGCKGLAKLLGYEDYRFIVVPVALLVLNIAYINFESIIDLSEWSARIWPYFSIPFLIIFPFIIFILGEYKYRKICKQRQ